MKWNIFVMAMGWLPLAVGSSLLHLRESIDRIDEQMYDLLVQRMECSRQIGRWKSFRNIHVKSREDEILDRLQQKNELDWMFVDRMWRVIFEESCRLQNKDSRRQQQVWLL